MSQSNPKVSVIIPSLDGYRDGNVPKLLADLKKQTVKDVEVVVIKGVSPNGHARNEGVKKAQGEFLVFIDDDARLGQNNVIENLIKPFEVNTRIGMTGASILLVKNASWLQRRYAKLRPSGFHGPVVDKITDSDLAQHTCCVMPAKVYREVGGESDDLITGTDNDLRQRLHRAGYRVVLVPDTIVYHIPPTELRQIIKICWRSGLGLAYAWRRHPEIFDYPKILGKYRIKTASGVFIYKIGVLPIKIIWNLITLHPIRLIFAFYINLGFIWGWFKYR